MDGHPIYCNWCGYTNEISDLVYYPGRGLRRAILAKSLTLWNGIVSNGLKLELFGFLPFMHTRTNAKPKHPQSLCAVSVLSSRSDRSRCRWHTPDELHFWITRKTQRSPIWAHCQDRMKMMQVLRSRLVYLWVDTTSIHYSKFYDT